MLIAIDGGSASGKSTLAKTISERFGIPLLESGSLYRALTLEAIQAGISFSETEKLEKFINSLSLKIELSDQNWVLIINDKKFNPKALRSLEVTEQVGVLSKSQRIREKVLTLQRSCYEKRSGAPLVVEGRDMGTTVFPSSDIKIFLKVSESEQAKRRALDFKASGISISEEETRRQELRRDAMDRERKISPLKIAKNAFVIDTSGKIPIETYREAVSLINRRRRRASFIYRFLKALGFIFAFYLRVKVEGGENIPKQGGFILASNHSSHLDPIALGIASPRYLSFMARHTLYEINPFFSWFLSKFNVHPIDRHSPDRGSLSRFNIFLLEGQGIVYFPEGTRSCDGELGDFKKGVGVIGVRTTCPVIPVYISGTYEAMAKGAKFARPKSVEVNFGKAVDLSDLYDQELSHELYEKAALRVREAVLRLKESLRS